MYTYIITLTLDLFFHALGYILTHEGRREEAMANASERLNLTSDDTALMTSDEVPDELLELLKSKEERDRKVQEMRARVAQQMEARMDTGIRVNHALARAFHGVRTDGPQSDSA